MNKIYKKLILKILKRAFTFLVIACLMLSALIIQPSKIVAQTLADCSPVDKNDDSKINITDLLAFAQNYKKNCNPKTILGCGSQDVNGDGLINIADLANFAQRYKTSTCILSNFQIAKQRWPKIVGTSGPYLISPKDNFKELEDVAANGHNWFLYPYNSDPTSNIQQQLNAQMEKTGLKYVTTAIWDFIYAACKSAYTAPNCLIDQNPTLQAQLLSKVENFLKSPDIVSNPNIIGFWILDDTWGDIHTTLELINQKIKNAPAPFPRPAMCGFGGSLAYRKTVTTTIYSAKFQNFTDAIATYSPKACDITLFYPYAYYDVVTNQNPDLQEWNMATILPRYLNDLKVIGHNRDPDWNPDTLIWGGVDHAFGGIKPGDYKYGYQLPRKQDMLTQAEAYCKAGGTVMSFFSWDNKYADIWQLPSNNSELRAGAKESVELCKNNYWK